MRYVREPGGLILSLALVLLSLVLFLIGHTRSAQGLLTAVVLAWVFLRDNNSKPLDL